jgi:hypothetical protein
MAEFCGFSMPIFEGFFEWVHAGALGAAIGDMQPHTEPLACRSP